MENQGQRHGWTPIASEDQSEPAPRPTTASGLDDDNSEAERAAGDHISKSEPTVHDDASAPATPSVITNADSSSLNKNVVRNNSPILASDATFQPGDQSLKEKSQRCPSPPKNNLPKRKLEGMTSSTEPISRKKRGRPTVAGARRRAIEAAARGEVYPPPRRGRVSITAPPEYTHMGGTSSSTAQPFHDLWNKTMSQDHREHNADNGLGGANAASVPNTRQQRYNVTFAANYASVNIPSIPRSVPSPRLPTLSQLRESRIPEVDTTGAKSEHDHLLFVYGQPNSKDVLSYNKSEVRSDPQTERPETAPWQGRGHPLHDNFSHGPAFPWLPSVAELIASSKPYQDTPGSSNMGMPDAMSSNSESKRKSEHHHNFESRKWPNDSGQNTADNDFDGVNSRRQDSAVGRSPYLSPRAVLKEQLHQHCDVSVFPNPHFLPKVSLPDNGATVANQAIVNGKSVLPIPERHGEDNMVYENTSAKLEPVPIRSVSSDTDRRLFSQPECSPNRDDTDRMTMIQNVVLKGLGDLNTEFSVNWDVMGFMRSQYSEIPSVASIVVVTGTALYAHATTCGEYVNTNWPTAGSAFLDLLDKALAHDIENTAMLTMDLGNFFLIMGIEIRDDRLDVLVYSAPDSIIIELAQLLAWIGSALSISPYGEDMAYGVPSVVQTQHTDQAYSTTNVSFDITFEHEPLHVTDISCWLPLFSRMTIVSGFPIARRGDEIGLEVSLQLLAAIAGISHVTRFEGGLVMKGFCNLIVPVQKTGDRLQWHVITSQDSETYLSYQAGLSRCRSRLLLEEVGVDDLKSTRAFLGWCSVYTSRLGSKEVDFDNIDYSGATEASGSIHFNGAQVGFQQWATATANFSIGAKQTKHYIGREGPFRSVTSAAERTPVLLYDTHERRGYLVSATDVMLHMIQHRHRLEPFEINSKHVFLETGVPTGSTAKEILRKNQNLSLSDDGSYTFKHVVHSIWSILEDLRAKTVTKNQDAQGIAVQNPLIQRLCGYEFKAIVQERGDYTLMETELSQNHGGWPLLIRDINALVLLADGFGDLITPADLDKSRLCNVWQRVPSGCDYIATTSNVLTDLYDVAGSRASRRYLTTTRLQWHQGESQLFDACGNTNSCQCNRLQQIARKSDTVVLPNIGDVKAGAIIFGNRDSLLQSFASTLRLKVTPKPPFYHHKNAVFTTAEDYQRKETVSMHTSSKSDPTVTTLLLSLDVGPCNIIRPASEKSPNEVASEVIHRPDKKRLLRPDSACAEIDEDKHNYDRCENLPLLKRKKPFRSGSTT